MRRSKTFAGLPNAAPWSFGLLCAVLSPGQTPATIEQQLLSHDTDVALQALKHVAESKSLYRDQRIQRAVIHVLNRESTNPKWGDLAELQSYEDYYSQLLDTTKVIAVETHDQQAWAALVTANYNADSPYGLWLSKQPEAVPVLIEQASNKEYSTIRSRAIWVMGYTAAACTKDASLPICYQDTKDRLLGIIRQHAANDPMVSGAGYQDTKDRLLGIIRQHAANDPMVSGAAITALEFCGTLADIPLLESIRSKYRNPDDPTNALDWAVNHAEAAIRKRADAKPSLKKPD